MESECVRLSKLLSTRGICSRREADAYIQKGWVLVDGEIVSILGTKVALTAKIELSSEAKQKQNQKITLVLNKPIGYVSTQPEKGYKSAIELIPPKYRPDLSVVGRLDIDSKGLLLFTQDGTVAKAVIGPKSAVEKEYLVRVKEEVSDYQIEKLRYGLSLDGERLKRAGVVRLDVSLLKVILTQGKKRQIRRMCDLVGLKVISLKRVRIGNLKLGTLALGEWRVVNNKNLKF